MLTKELYIWIIGTLLVACGYRQQESKAPTAAHYLEEAEAALANDSIRLGESLLHKAIHLAEETDDWHTDYIAYQRLAETVSQSNPEEALRLMKKALTVYEQHPDDRQHPMAADSYRQTRNYVILLDYTGTYAAQATFNAEGTYDEALGYINQAYDTAKKNGMTDLMCQTLTSLANIAWAQDNYRQAIDYCYQAKTVATAELMPGVLQVMARSYLSLNLLDSAETVYRQIEPGDDVHMAYIIQSNLAKIALRRVGATQAEDYVAEAFEQMEDFYYKALTLKDLYYQETLRKEIENQQLETRSQGYRRTMLLTVIATFIIIIATMLAARYKMQAQRREKIQLQREAEHQKTLLHQANEVVTFLQNFILERTEVIKKLNQGGNSLIYLSPHEWNEIERTLNAIDNNRFANIRKLYPNVQEDDIQLCILTRLGLSNRTIGNIFCISISAVQHRKLKLKKDGFGETSPNITLEQILKKI